MLAYDYISKDNDIKTAVDEDNQEEPIKIDNEETYIPRMSELLVERIQRKIRHPHQCHRNIKDQETKFLDDMLIRVKSRLSNQD